MPTPPQKDKILIIESNAFFNKDITDALRKEDYSVISAKDGAEGMKTLYAELPRLVILDITLSDCDGYDFIDKKQAEPMLSKIPVFLLSTQGLPINMRRIPQNSVAEFILTLHSDVAEVVRKVDKYFGRPSEKVETEPATVNDRARKRILWVEDDKLIGAILSKKLSASGFDVRHFENGEEALKELQNDIPDLIILDLILPGMSGFDILQKIRMDKNHDALQKVPVMILSNLSKPSDFEKAKILGAAKFLVKAAVSLDQIVEEAKELAGK